MPCLRWAYDGIDEIRRIQDFSTTLIKRERIDGKLLEHEYMFVKIRHRPFSVYMYFLGPEKKGRRWSVSRRRGTRCWPQDRNQKLFGTVSLDRPADCDDRQSLITEVGIVARPPLIEVGEKDVNTGMQSSTFRREIENRLCTCLRVIHPVPLQFPLPHRSDLRRRRTEPPDSLTYGGRGGRQAQLTGVYLRPS